MEQALINSLLQLISRAGGISLIRDLISEVDENGDPKTWNVSELQKAVEYINWQADSFGTAEAVAVIDNLLKKYNIRLDSLQRTSEDLEEPARVAGLQ